MKKWITTIIIIIVIILIILHQLNKPKAVFTTISIARGNIEQQAVAIGNIIPKHATTVKSTIDGIVGQIYHEAGDYVTSNTELLRIKPQPKPIDVAQTLSNIERDKAAVKAAQRQEDSYNKLLKQGIITRNYTQYISTIQTLKQSQAQLAYDKQQLQLMQQGQANIDGKTLRNIVVSPIDGYILARDVDVGDPVVSLGSVTTATTLYTIANMHDLVFQGDVDESDASRLHTGMSAAIKLAALPNIEVTGTIKLLSLQSEQQSSLQPSVSTNSQSNSSPFNVGYEVRIENLQIPKSVKLRSGYSATATITLKTVKNALLIPERAIVFKNEQAFAKIIVGKNKTKLVPLKLGISDGISAQVISGLSEGQKIVDSSASQDSQ